MNDPNNFSKNLMLMKQRSNLSWTKFSQLAQVPRSTMQSVMKDGQTTLDTACRISNSLGLPLSTLTEEPLSPEDADLLHRTFMLLDSYQGLSPEKQEQFQLAANILMEVFRK